MEGTNMLKVVAKMTVAPEAKDSVTALVEELVAATVKEDGCINYNFCQELEGTDSYAIIETWASKEALDAHMQSEHFTRLIPEISALVTGEIEIAVFTVLL
jgi:quinol monooxygenase YgiN